jgi:hypothetical protein
MTSTFATTRINRTLLALAFGLSALAFGVWGTERGIAATVGAIVALLNWFALRWLGTRIASGTTNQRAAVSMLLVGKIGVLMALTYVLINKLQLDPIGLCLGLGVLFLGPVLGSLLDATATPPMTPGLPAEPGKGDTVHVTQASAADAARQER